MESLSERILGTKTLKELEYILATALEDVELIGELPISSEAFHHLVHIQRDGGTFSNKKAKLSEPVTYIVSMVFSARYDNDESRRFWQPYLQEVWQLPRNQSNYETARENFFAARDYLQEKYGLHFPTKLHQGEVVHSIYWHTIIPAYLHDDFARWIAPLFGRFLSISEEDLEKFITSETATLYIAPRLRSFLQDEAGIAVRLIQELLAAYALYIESGDAQLVYECLPSPIYHSLWQQILPELGSQTQASMKSKREAKPQWVWSLQDEEWVLRFVNLFVEAEREPRLVIWSKAAPVQAFWDNYWQHEVWPERIEGQWRISERSLGSLQSLEMLDAKIYLYDRNSALIREYPVPELPSGDYLIYRISQQGQYAIPLPQPYKLIDGQYLISYRGDFRLETQDGPVEPQKEFFGALPTGNGSHRAALYRLQLPTTIQSNGEVETFHASESRQVIAEIRGDGKLDHLAIDVPPVFTKGNLRLVLAHLPAKYQHLQFVIRGKESIKHEFLKPYLVHTEEGHVLDLTPHLDLERIGSYEIDISYNLQSRLPAPLQFSILPNFRAEAPTRQLYNPLHLPQVTLWSEMGEILASHSATKEVTGKASHITWHDLREDLLRLQVRDGDNYVPLAWRIQRVAAWFEQTQSPKFLLPDEIQQARLEIRGEPEQHLVLRIGKSRYEIPLNAKGRYSEYVRDTRIKDMLAENKDDDILLQIESYGESWPLATYVRRPRVLSLQIEYFHKLGISCDIRLSHETLGQKYQLQILNSRDEVIIEAPVENFNKSIDIEYKDFSPDVYRLQLLQNGKALPMPENRSFTVELPMMSFFLVDYKEKLLNLAYQIERLVDGEYTLEIWQESQLVCREIIDSLSSEHELACQLSDGLYTFKIFWNQHCIHTEAKQIDSRFAEDESLVKQVWLNQDEQLYHWAGLSAAGLLKASAEQTYKQWRPLRRLAEIHQADVWQHKYGAIPAWALLDKSLRFTVQSKTYLLYPEKVLERGRTGIGKIALNLQDIPYAYAHWTSAYHRMVRLQVLIPPKDPEKRPYSELDELDLWPAYFDVKQGNIHGSRTGKLRPGKQLDGSFLTDMVHNYQCYGFMDTNNRPLIPSLDEDASLDRYFTADCLEDNVPDDVLSYANLINPAGYRFAVDEWIVNYFQNLEAKQAIKQLVEAQNLAAFHDCATTLLQLAGREAVPYLKGVKRFLQGMENQVNSHETHRLMLLDRHIFLLAVVLRAANLPASSFQKQVRESLRFSDAELIDVLRLANFACPSLLEWALTWTEILFVHSAA